MSGHAEKAQTPAVEEYFSPLDIHFARAMQRLSKDEDPDLFLAAALVSRATSEGHVCLNLASVAGTPPPVYREDAAETLCPPLAPWRRKLLATKVVGRPGEFAPLILDEASRLYLYRYWAYENSLARDLLTRAAAQAENIDLSLLSSGLSKLFGHTGGKETDWQKVAAFACTVKLFSVISGGPGTGKTSVISKVLALILEQARGKPLRMALTAPTGKAAARLEQAVKAGKEALPLNRETKSALSLEASTIHRLLGAIADSPYFRHNKDNPLPLDLVVVDEASMVDLALMSKLVQALPSSARLILLGDKDQLASVQAGAVLGDICDTGHIHGFSQEFTTSFEKITGERMDTLLETASSSSIQDCVVHLKKSYRFAANGGIGRVSEAINRGEGQSALDLLRNGQYDDISWRPLPRDSLHGRLLRDAVLEGYRAYLVAGDVEEAFSNFERFRILCALRRGPHGVESLNRQVEAMLREEGLIKGLSRWYRGCPVLITRNDYDLGLFNGDIGIILPDPALGNELRAFFRWADGSVRKFLPARLPPHEPAFAMTVHKSQGSEFDRALLILPEQPSPVITRELLYTGITRARERVEVWGREEVFVDGVRRRIERASGLRDALWGDRSFLAGSESSETV